MPSSSRLRLFPLVLQGEEKEGGAVGRLNLQGRVASISQGISWERYSTDGASVSSLTAIKREQAKGGSRVNRKVTFSRACAGLGYGKRDAVLPFPVLDCGNEAAPLS